MHLLIASTVCALTGAFNLLQYPPNRLELILITLTFTLLTVRFAHEYRTRRQLALKVGQQEPGHSESAAPWYATDRCPEWVTALYGMLRVLPASPRRQAPVSGLPRSA